jgi:hypothetical protein
MRLPNHTRNASQPRAGLSAPNEPFAAFNAGFHESYPRLVEQVLAHLGTAL